MADFMTNLWEAVFEAGPTPTLLLATNATFAALQVLLFTLLVATRSVHFIVLSTLCAGLWVSINWFAAELMSIKNNSNPSSEQDGEKSAISKDVDDPAALSDGSEPVKATGIASSSSSAGHITRQRHMQASVESIGDVSMDSDWEQVESER